VSPDSRIDIVLLGSTGRLGGWAFAELLGQSERFRLVGLGGGQRADVLANQARRWHASNGHWPRLGVATTEAADALRAALSEPSVEVEVGAPGGRRLAAAGAGSVVVCAIGGLAAWPAVQAAADAGAHLVIASKEVLALAGHVLRTRAEERGGALHALDSELTAAAQLLAGSLPGPGVRLLLPATGGPFRTWSPGRLREVTPEAAVRHPVWDMGPKISVDSATGVNKALEVVVAHRLFGLAPAQLEVVIHPEARVHAILVPIDGEERALVAPPDMRLPLRHLLGLPTPEVQILSPRPRAGVSFEPLVPERFPGAALGHEALARGPGAVAALVGADDAAVEAFLAGRLPFPELVPILQRTVAQAPACSDEPDALRQAAENAREKLRRRLF